MCINLEKSGLHLEISRYISKYLLLSCINDVDVATNVVEIATISLEDSTSAIVSTKNHRIMCRYVEKVEIVDNVDSTNATNSTIQGEIIKFAALQR